MKKYGEPINGWDDITIQRNTHDEKKVGDGELPPLYNAFIRYFDNPVFTKMKDVDGISMYMCKTYCLLGTVYRYIVLLVAEDSNRLGSTLQMSSIKNWFSLQTRTLEDCHNIPIHNYQAKRGSSLDSEIIRYDVTDIASSYKCSKIPNISVTLLHKKNSDPLSYANKGTVISALETFNTIIAFDDFYKI
jgi:hypothetical protein